VIDIHAHVLPGLDDGPETMDEAIEVLRSMTDDGVRVVCATPHVREDYPTSVEQMRDGLARVREAALEAELPIDVRPGGEVALDELSGLTADDRAAFGLGGNPRVLLLEFPYYGWPLSLPMQCEQLLAEEVVPVIAHPERSEDVQEAPGRLGALVELGAVVQVTAASVDGRLGRRSAACARTLIELGLAHVIASDAHAPWLRGAGMSKAVAAAGSPELGRWLVEDVPTALLAGDPLPPRPPMTRRRAWWRR
jgi:protein-tyrosine phosphatase